MDMSRLARSIRGIESSLKAFARMRAVCLFLRTRAVIKFVLRAASTFENTRMHGEQRALREFRAARCKRWFAPSGTIQLIWLTPPKQD